jgi:hypothetical protein
VAVTIALRKTPSSAAFNGFMMPEGLEGGTDTTVRSGTELRQTGSGKIYTFLFAKPP